MKNIKIHTIDTIDIFNELQEYTANKLIKYQGKSKNKFRFLIFLYVQGLRYIRINRLNIEDIEKEKYYFKLVLNSISEVSRLAHFPGKEMDAIIDESGPFKILVEDLNEIGYEWCNSYYLAVIARDTKRLRDILSLPIELLNLTSGTPATDYRNLFLRLSIKFFSDNVFDSNIYDELELIKEENLSFVKADPSYKNVNIIFTNDPVVETMRSLDAENEQEFYINLVKALDAHKAYWGQHKPLNPGGTPLCRDECGFISFPCTALAAMAYDKGWKLEVESDYMPAYMVDGSIIK